MKDGLSLTRIEVFFSALPVAKAVASVASSVASPLTISSSGITATGLKKWKPTTRSGCSRSAAISVIDSEEVLVASTHSARDDLLDVGEDGLLDRHLLEDGLDHEVGVAEGDLLVGLAGDQRLVAVGLVLVDPALGEQLVDLGVDVGDALVGALLVEVGQHDRHLEAAYEQQRELAGHQAGADDADLGDRAGQRLVGGTGRTLGALLHQVEGVERGQQLGRLRHRLEGVVLGGEARVAVGVARGRRSARPPSLAAGERTAGLGGHDALGARDRGVPGRRRGRPRGARRRSRRAAPRPPRAATARGSRRRRRRRRPGRSRTPPARRASCPG